MSNVVEFFERRKYIFFRCAGVVARRIPLSRVASSQPARKRLFSLYLSRSRVLAPIATARRRAYCSRMCLSVFRGIELGFVFTLSLHVSCAFKTYFVLYSLFRVSLLRCLFVRTTRSIGLMSRLTVCSFCLDIAPQLRCVSFAFRDLALSQYCLAFSADYLLPIVVVLSCYLGRGDL